MKWNILFSIIICGVWSNQSYAQEESKVFDFKSIDVQINMGMHQPIGQLNERFGNNSAIGAKLDYRWAQSNISLGIDGMYLFGSNVKENVLAPFYTRDSFIYGAGGVPAVVFLRERGYYLGAHISKLWARRTNKRLGGLKASLGIGFLQHKIKVLDDTRSTLQFFKPYGYGYDRLTYGFSARQDIGYQYYSSNNRINFYIGMHIIEAYTKNRRSWNFDIENPIQDEWRWDVLLGGEIGWIIPFYFGHSNSEEKLIFY